MKILYRYITPHQDLKIYQVNSTSIHPVFGNTLIVGEKNPFLHQNQTEKVLMCCYMLLVAGG